MGGLGSGRTKIGSIKGENNITSYPLLKELWEHLKLYLNKDTNYGEIRNPQDSVSPLERGALATTKKGWIKKVAELKNTKSSAVQTLSSMKGLDSVSVLLRTGAYLNAMNLSDEFKLSIDQGLASIFKKHGYNPQIEMNQRGRVSFVEDLLDYCRKIFPNSLVFQCSIDVPAVFKLTIDKSLAQIFKKHGYHPKIQKSQEEYVALIEDIVFYCRETTKYKVIAYPESSIWANFTFNVDGMKTPITYRSELLPDKNGIYNFQFHRKGDSVINMNTIGLQRYRYRGNDSVPNIAFIKYKKPKAPPPKTDEQKNNVLAMLDEI